MILRKLTNSDYGLFTPPGDATTSRGIAELRHVGQDHLRSVPTLRGLPDVSFRRIWLHLNPEQSRPKEAAVPDGSQTSVTYVMGYTDEERRRLIEQAGLLRRYTKRMLEDAGIGQRAGMASERAIVSCPPLVSAVADLVRHERLSLGRPSGAGAGPSSIAGLAFGGSRCLRSLALSDPG